MIKISNNKIGVINGESNGWKKEQRPWYRA